MTTDQRPLQDWSVLTVGENFGPYSYEVSGEVVDAYRAVAGDHVVESDGNAAFAPPTLLNFAMLQMIESKYRPRPGVIHARQVIDLRQPIKVGAHLTLTGVLTEMRLKRHRRYFTVESTVVDETGAMVATGQTVALYPEVDLDVEGGV